MEDSSRSFLMAEPGGGKFMPVAPHGLDPYDCRGWDMPTLAIRNFYPMLRDDKITFKPANETRRDSCIVQTSEDCHSGQEEKPH